LLYPAFTACSKDSVWSTFAYWVTQSAGKFGTLGIVLVTSSLFATHFKNPKKKAWTFIQSFLGLTILLSTFAFLNEHVIKPAVGFARPSHSYIIEKTKSNANLDSLYALTTENRKTFFKNILASDTVHFNGIDQRILDHWVDEAGYSFPSGHSFNAFLLASILAFSIYKSEHRKIKYLYFIPLLWALLVAISRVAVGAHSPLDVSVGAGIGLIVSHVLLSIGKTRNIIVPKRLDT
jgi:phosphatidylglycerophosphatase B